MGKIVLEIEWVDHTKVILKNERGDTYVSGSEQLMDFLHGVKNLNEETETKPNTQCDCKTKPECYVKGCIKTG